MTQSFFGNYCCCFAFLVDLFVFMGDIFDKKVCLNQIFIASATPVVIISTMQIKCLRDKSLHILQMKKSLGQLENMKGVLKQPSPLSDPVIV